jgi:hypothetical protein
MGVSKRQAYVATLPHEREFVDLAVGPWATGTIQSA